MTDDISALPPAACPRFQSGAGLLLGLGALAFLIYYSASLYGRCLQDDTYISFVYARNFARGAGLVYNVGELPVEGYTNFLWTLLVGFAMRLELSPEHTVQLLGIASAALVLVLVMLLMRRLGGPWLAAGIAGFLLATLPPFVWEAVGGLETHLFAALVLLGLYLRLPENPSERALLGSSLAFGLAALTRPEGVLLFALVAAFDLTEQVMQRHGSGRLRFQQALAISLRRAWPFLILVTAHLLWRRFTYGDWVPNTFHAKVSGGAASFERGYAYVENTVRGFGVPLFLLPYLNVPGWWRDRRFRLCLFVSSMFTLYVISIGGDFKPTARYLLPVLPLWAVLAVTTVSRFRRHWKPLAILCLAAYVGWRAFPVQFGDWPEERIKRNRELLAVGRHLDATLPADAWIAVSNAGIIPYEADRRTLDMLGLNDAHIAHQPVGADAPGLPGHQKGDPDYLFALRPEAILFLRLEVTPGSLAAHPQRQTIIDEYAFGTSERGLWKNPRFAEEYALKSVPLDGDIGYANYFLRRDLLPSNPTE